jgi:glycosyltransferase involved in cell wall biosynthesis
VVVPSHWLYNLVKQSPVFENKPIHRIVHGLDLELFKLQDKASCRKALGIPGNARVLMFSSSDDLSKSPWKGGQLLVDLLTAIDSKIENQIETLVLGKGQLTGLKHLQHLNLHQMGYINNEKLITILLSAADLFIYPTRADSLGLVLVEAIACGTPCITFDLGGCRDVIQNDVSGYLIEPFAVEKFANKTIEVLNNKEKLESLSKTSRKFAQQHFDIADMAKRYYDLFSSIQNPSARGA